MKLRWMERDTVSNKQLWHAWGCLDSVSSRGSAGHAESWAGWAGSEDTRARAGEPVQCTALWAVPGAPLQVVCAPSLSVDEACTCQSPALPGQVHKPGILRTGQETEVSGTPTRFQIFWHLSREHKWSPLGSSANSYLFQPNGGQAVFTKMDFSIHRSRTEQQFSTLWFIRITSSSLKSNNTQALTFSESLLWCSSRMETGCSCSAPKWLDVTSSLGATRSRSSFHP